tara:strand:- start:8173 stop:11010 length:2838 start_codon:yes stop_codon:yes gene_type:complete
MPLGASRLTLLAFQASVATSATVIRKKIGLSAKEQVQVDTAQYKYGASALFDGGTDDYILVDHTEQNIDYADDFTIEMWARWTSLPGSNSFSMLASTSTRGDYIALYNKAGTYTMTAALSDGSTIYYPVFNTPVTPSTNTWYHLAFVKNGATFKMYWDGTECDTDNGSAGTMSASLGMNGIHRIGDWGSGTSYAMNGHIDEFRVSKDPRYTAENFLPRGPFVNDDKTKLLVHMDGFDTQTHFGDDNSAVVTENRSDSNSSNLKLAVPFDDINGVNDISHTISGTGLSSAATVTQGTCSVSSGGSKWPWYNNSLINNNTGTSGLTYALPSGFGNAASATYALSVWVRATDATSNNNWALSSGESGGRWLFGINTGSSYSFGNENNIGLGDTEWHHIAIVNNAGTHLFYTDGVYKGAWVSSNTGFSTLHVGQFNGSDNNNFRGNMQDLRVYIGSDNSYSGTNASNKNFPLPKSILQKQPKGLEFIAEGNAQIDTSTSQFGGSSLLLDGSGDYIQHKGSTDSETFHMQGAFTMELWYKPESDTGDATAALATIGTGDGDTNYSVGLFHRNFDMKPQIVFCPFSESDSSRQSIFVIGGSAVSANTWNHIAMASDGSSFSCWLNGTRMNNTSFTGTAPLTYGSDGNITIGGNNGGGLPFNQGGNGYIDEFRLSKTDIYGVSNSSITVPTGPFTPNANTMSLMHFNGSDGSQVMIPDSGKDRPQAPVCQAGSTPVLDTTSYKYGVSSVEFDDTDDYIEVKDIDIGNFSGDFTIEGWFDTNDTLGEFISCQKQGTAEGWALVTRSSQRLVWASTTDGTNASALVSSTSAYSDNTWQHWAVCHNNSTGLTEIFANGARVGSRTEQNPKTVTSGGYFRIGGNIYGVSSNTYSDGPRYFGGHLDEIRISNSVRYSGSTYTIPTESFQNDANTTLLLHFDGTDGDNTFVDDNGDYA